MPPFLTPTNKGTLLTLKVIPNARKTAFGDTLENALKLYVCAPPVEGKANSEIVKFFKKTFALKTSQIIFLKGEKSSYKQVLLLAPYDTIASCDCFCSVK